jgi:hypothetical protein
MGINSAFKGLRESRKVRDVQGPGKVTNSLKVQSESPKGMYFFEVAVIDWEII